MARELPGYGEVIFPHCPCDSRKTGHVMAAVGYLGLRLIACTEDGILEVILKSCIFKFQFLFIRQFI